MPETVDAALVVLRVSVGGVFAAHGVKHFVNREKTIRWARSIGFSAPSVQWFFMTFAEIGVGVSLLAGFLTAFGAAGVVSLMAVAFWTVHRRAGFWITSRPDEGWEYAFVLSAAAWALALLGPGDWSVDQAIGIAVDLEGGTGALIASGGILAAIAQMLAFFRRRG